MRPICCSCYIEMDCARNDIVVWHPTEDPNGKTFHDKESNWEHIDLVAYGDMYRCRSCGRAIVTGLSSPIVNTGNQKELLGMIKETMKKSQVSVIRITRT